MIPRLKLDPIPDGNGHHTIRPDDGTETGDTSAQPVATVYDYDTGLELVAALNSINPCQSCDGLGRVFHDTAQRCEWCQGTGKEQNIPTDPEQDR